MNFFDIYKIMKLKHNAKLIYNPRKDELYLSVNGVNQIKKKLPE